MAAVHCVELFLSLLPTSLTTFSPEHVAALQVPSPRRERQRDHDGKPDSHVRSFGGSLAV